MNLAQAKSELMVTKKIRQRWIDLYNITGKPKYIEFEHESLVRICVIRQIIREIEKNVLTKQRK